MTLLKLWNSGIVKYIELSVSGRNFLLTFRLKQNDNKLVSVLILFMLSYVIIHRPVGHVRQMSFFCTWWITYWGADNCCHCQRSEKNNNELGLRASVKSLVIILENPAQTPSINSRWQNNWKGFTDHMKIGQHSRNDSRPMAISSGTGAICIMLRVRLNQSMTHISGR